MCPEMTTMAGRRLRDAVMMTLVEKGSGQFDANTHIVIAGLAGDYSQYITTFEEYEAQRYEVRSKTVPHSLVSGLRTICSYKCLLKQMK